MDFTRQAQLLISELVEQRSGSDWPKLAVDGTAGNGFDTLFLAQLMRGRGQVLAFDIHPTAIANTRQRLCEAGFANSVSLLHCCHSQLVGVLDQMGIEKLSVAMFNLGYLPYCQDQPTPTRANTTLPALQQTIDRLDGILTVLAYVGHPGGKEESQVIESWVTTLTHQAQVESYRDDNPISPTLWVIRK